MGHNDPLLQILILLAASVCVVAAVRKLALPAILGYLAVGMLLGPHALALAADNETTQLLADFGVVFLVFTLGLEFSLPRLVAMRWEVLGVGGAQVLVTTGSSVAAGAILLLRCGAGGRRGHRRRGGHVLDGHHHLAVDRAVGKQPHPRPSRRGDLPVSGFELSAASGLGVGIERRRRRRRCRAHRRRHRHRRARPAAGAGRGAVAAAAAVSGDRLGAFPGTVFAGGVACGAGLGLGHACGGAVAGARRISRRHDAGGNRIPASDRGHDPVVSRSAARACFSSPSACCSTSACCCGTCRW